MALIAHISAVVLAEALQCFALEVPEEDGRRQERSALPVPQLQF